MSSNTTAPSYRTWAVVAACAIAVAGVVTIASKQGQVQIDPGTEVLSVADDGIRTLSYRTDTMTLTARRSANMGPFVIDVVYGDGQAAQHCESSRDLGGVLSGLVKIVATRQLTQQQAMAEFPVQLGTLVLEDQIPSEPIEPIIVRTSVDRSKVAVLLKDAAIETTAAPATFAKLAGGCASLAAKEIGR